MKDLSEMTAADLAAGHHRACDPAERIGGMRWKKGKARLIERIEHLRRDSGPLGDAGTAERESEAAEDVDAEPDGRREAVGALVEAMLMTDAAYDEIVAAVRARFPEARTSRRSVASVASALRRRGVEVPHRRGQAGR